MNVNSSRHKYLLEMWISVYAVCGVSALLSRGFILYALVPGGICILMLFYHKKESSLRGPIFNSILVAVGGGALLSILFWLFPTNQAIISLLGIFIALYLGIRVYILYMPLLKKTAE